MAYLIFFHKVVTRIGIWIVNNVPRKIVVDFYFY